MKRALKIVSIAVTTALMIKRKCFSALWRLKQAAVKGYQATIQIFVAALTDKYWLLDFLPPCTKKQQGILLVRLDLIGDFVLWLDAAQAYKQLYPDKKITLAVNSLCAKLAATLPFWDEVISIDVHKLRTDYRYRLYKLANIRRHNFEIAVQPTFSREFVGDLLVRASYAQVRVGYNGDLHNITSALKVRTDRWYTKLVQSGINCTMELNINSHFVRELGLKTFLSDLPKLRNTQPLSDRFRYLSTYIVIAVGASWRPRMWPISYFADLIKQLRTEFDLPIILCGTQADYDLCNELIQTVNLNDVSNLAGQTSLLELIEIIRGATLLVGNESSPIHIAAATGTPSVCILGGGHFGRFLPYTPEIQGVESYPLTAWHKMDCFNCQWKCKFNPSVKETVPCISNILVGDVTQACNLAVDLRRKLNYLN